MDKNRPVKSLAIVSLVSFSVTHLIFNAKTHWQACRRDVTAGEVGVFTGATTAHNPTTEY